MIRQPNKFTFSFKSISPFKRVVGVLLGLGYAAILYAFQFLLRELLRVTCTSEFNEMWLLSDVEVSFYNCFAAALSLLIGQSICLAYWFSRPKRFAERGIRSRSTIINDQRVLQVSFLMWFLKLGFLYAIFFGLTWPNGHYGMRIYPDFAVMFVLVILVLFFQSWNTIRLKFKIKSYKWMLFAFFTLGLASWGISKINVVDYKAVNERILAENIWVTHDLQVPEVEGSERIEMRGEDHRTYIFFRSNEDTNIVLLKEDNRWQPVYQGGEYDHHFANTWCKRNTTFGHALLYIDKRIKMKVIRQIWSDFRDSDIIFLSYAVLPVNAKYPPAAYHGTVINAIVPYEYESQTEYLKSKARRDTLTNQIRIEHNRVGTCNVNGKEIAYQDLETELFELFIANTDFMVEYIYSDELPFDNYIQFKVAANAAMIRVKDFFSWDERGEAYQGQEYYDEKYPLRMSIVNASFLLEESSL